MYRRRERWSSWAEVIMVVHCWFTFAVQLNDDVSGTRSSKRKSTRQYLRGNINWRATDRKKKSSQNKRANYRIISTLGRTYLHKTALRYILLNLKMELRDESGFDSRPDVPKTALRYILLNLKNGAERWERVRLSAGYLKLPWGIVLLLKLKNWAERWESVASPCWGCQAFWHLIRASSGTQFLLVPTWKTDTHHQK